MSILTSPTAAELSRTHSALDFVRDELEMVERYLEQQVDTPIRQLSHLGEHLLRAGGKRLRPALVILSAHIANPEQYAVVRRNGHGTRERLIKIAACMELIHMATLIHDDVIDKTATRRGKPTANALFGNLATVLSGDYLLAKAMRHFAFDGDLSIIRKVATITSQMSEGEVEAVFLRNRIDLSEEEYYEVIRKKTAVFLSGCCAIGGLIANAPNEMVQRLETFGIHIGMAFQIVDDLLDYTGDPTTTGKQTGTDFRDGCTTLPLLHLNAHADEGIRARLRAEFGEPISEEILGGYVREMHEAGSLLYAQNVAIRHLQQALHSLQTLPDSEARYAMQNIAHFIVARSN
jgi:geranylgeranyl pyrophosphate synthase